MSSPAIPRAHRIGCRQIIDSDVENVAVLLAEGFPARSSQYWLNGLARLAKHPTPTGSPKYGYVMESDNALVGVVLLISSAIPDGNAWSVRCNISSWYVAPPFRSLSTLPILRATSHPDITYTDISPAEHTWRTIEAQGFSRYSNGQFVAVPGLRTPSDKAKVVEVKEQRDAICEPFERDLLLRHSNYGCLSLWCTTAEGAYPFVFLPRMVKRIIPCFQLIYCRDIGDYVRFGRLLAWNLASRGRPFVIIDSNGPIRGLRGRYFENKVPKYFKGQYRPRLGDLAYTEAPMFGL